MEKGINPFKEEFFYIAKKLRLDLEAASFVEHSGLKGARIESVLAEFLQETLPTRYFVSTNQIIIDCEGRRSQECDIVIHDRHESFRLLRQHIPVETVFAVIEVKKKLDATAAKDFRKKVQTFRTLNYRGRHSNDIETELRKKKFHFSPPSYNLFSVSSSFSSLERFCAHVYTDQFGNQAWKNDLNYSDYLTRFESLCCSLDMGICRNTALQRNTFLALDSKNESQIKKKVSGEEFFVSDAAALNMFLTFLDPILDGRKLVTPFDHRSYSVYHPEISQGIGLDIDEFAKILGEVQAE